MLCRSQHEGVRGVEPREDLTRRTLLRRGAKLAYIAPVVIVAMKAEPAFAVSGGGGGRGRGGDDRDRAPGWRRSGDDHDD